MKLEQQLRRLSVGQRIAAIVVLLLLPMAVLSTLSVIVLNGQEISIRASVEESIHTLLPLTTLESYLEQALVDELEAQTDESVPDFAGLTENIDRTFSRIESTNNGPDLPQNMVASAQLAWHNARPLVQHLIESVRTPHPDDGSAADAQARDQLQQAVRDIRLAREHLARAVEARYVHAAAERRSQLIWLIWSWVVTLPVAAALIGAFLHSLLQPIKALGRAARDLGAGEVGARAPVTGNDELTALAERFNEMAAYWEATRQTLLTEAAEDPLTGLLNRRGILAQLKTDLATHERQQQPISLFIIDLDHFKAINDRFGHSAGDRALIWSAERMREMLRESDRLGRYGGDEFLAILPGTTRQQAQHIADRMTRLIQDAAARETAYPSISIGVASAPDDGWQDIALIKAADAALYGNKDRRKRPAI